MATQNPFANGAGGPNPNAGYQGLGGILAFLKNGINADQYNALGQGATGADGMAVGKAHGLFTGLSPYAAHFLATSGLLQAQTPATIDTTGLSGTDLLMANLKNAIAAQAPTTYKLADNGITADDLAQLFANGIGGHSAYGDGYGPGGANPPTMQNPGLPNRTLQPGGGRFSFGGRIPVAFGKKGHPFFSVAAARAAGALGNRAPGHRMTGTLHQQPR